jgi:hypothetical protein
VNLCTARNLAVFGFLAVATLATRQLNCQQLTLEGQTGGFLTPTAYVVLSEKGHTFSHPAIGFHYINASKVIGHIETVSITEGFANRAEIGYTRSVHQLGNSVTTTGSFSKLWDFNGMNVFHGKVVAIKDGQFFPLMPGIAFGGLVRTQDHFVSGAIYEELTGTAKSYTNGDVYVAVTKTWAKPPVPFLVNVGWKATNAVIFGIGGQSTRFGGRLFGGLGIPLPIVFGIVAVPSVGFTQEPPTAKGLGPSTGINIPLVAGKASLPTTLDYAVRVTQREHAHFAFDIGIGQVANNIGAIPIVSGGTVVGTLPVNLEARHVVGMGLSFRY